MLKLEFFRSSSNVKFRNCPKALAVLAYYPPCSSADQELLEPLAVHYGKFTTERFPLCREFTLIPSEYRGTYWALTRNLDETSVAQPNTQPRWDARLDSLCVLLVYSFGVFKDAAYRPWNTYGGEYPWRSMDFRCTDTFSWNFTCVSHKGNETNRCMTPLASWQSSLDVCCVASTRNRAYS